MRGGCEGGVEDGLGVDDGCWARCRMGGESGRDVLDVEDECWMGGEVCERDAG